MTKIICDICGKEMPTAIFVDNTEDLNFCISSHGKIWDICTECRVILTRKVMWMTAHREESEEQIWHI